MDWLIGCIVGSELEGTLFVEKIFTDLDYADDVVIFAENVKTLVDSLAALSQESETASLLDKY